MCVWLLINCNVNHFALYTFHLLLNFSFSAYYVLTYMSIGKEFHWLINLDFPIMSIMKGRSPNVQDLFTTVLRAVHLHWIKEMYTPFFLNNLHNLYSPCFINFWSPKEASTLPRFFSQCFLVLIFVIGKIQVYIFSFCSLMTKCLWVILIWHNSSNLITKCFVIAAVFIWKSDKLSAFMHLQCPPGTALKSMCGQCMM